MSTFDSRSLLDRLFDQNIKRKPSVDIGENTRTLLYTPSAVRLFNPDWSITGFNKGYGATTVSDERPPKLPFGPQLKPITYEDIHKTWDSKWGHGDWPEICYINGRQGILYQLENVHRINLEIARAERIVKPAYGSLNDAVQMIEQELERSYIATFIGNQFLCDHIRRLYRIGAFIAQPLAVFPVYEAIHWITYDRDGSRVKAEKYTKRWIMQFLDNWGV